MNKIVQQIEQQYKHDEQTIHTTIAWDDEEKCEISLLLSNLTLYIYRNIAFNRDVRYYPTSEIRNIEIKKNKYRLNFKNKEHLILLPIEEHISSFKKLLDILVLHGIAITDFDTSKRNAISIFNKVLILGIIVAISSLTVFGYKFFIVKVSGPSVEEQRLQREETKKKKATYIKKASQQKIFNTNFITRLEVYRVNIDKLYDALALIDISDKDLDWELQTQTINDITGEFIQIKIENDDMVDFGIHINKKKNYLRDETSNINYKIESLNDKIQQNLLTRFEDITTLISVKNQCTDISKLISDLIKDINNENNLIEQSISDD